MSRAFGLMCVCLLGLVLLVGSGSGGEKKETKAKGMLPAGWKALNLTAEQKAAVYKVQADYKTRVMDLEKKINELKAEERKEMAKVLTAEQKSLLAKIATGEDTTAPKKAAPEKEKK